MLSTRGRHWARLEFPGQPCQVVGKPVNGHQRFLVVVHRAGFTRQGYVPIARARYNHVINHVPHEQLGVREVVSSTPRNGNRPAQFAR